MNNPFFLVDTEFLMFGKLILSLFLGALIGTERAILARQAAGTRTFGLVAMGACMFVVIEKFVDAHYIGLMSFNPTYMAAAVITGVGFIGGGLIVFRGDTLHGVTTAAGLWIAAAIGVSVGFGLIKLSIFASLLTLVMFTGMWYIENRFKHWFLT